MDHSPPLTAAKDIRTKKLARIVWAVLTHGRADHFGHATA